MADSKDLSPDQNQIRHETNLQAVLDGARFAQLFEQMPIPLALLEGPDHRYVFANSIYRDYFLENKLYLGKTVSELVPDAATQGFVEILNGVYQTGERVAGNEVKFEQKKSSGKIIEFYFNFVVEAMRNSQGKITGVLAAIFDVTEQVRARTITEKLNRELQVEKDNFTRLFEQSSAYLAIIGNSNSDSDYVYEFSNPTHDEIMGGQSPVGRKVQEVVPDTRASGVINLLNSVMETGEPRILREVALKIGGKTKYFEGNYIPRKNIRGEVDGILAMGIDTTFRVETRKRLEQSERQLTKAVEVAKVGFYDLDLTKNIVTYSDQMMADWGLTGSGTLEDALARIHPDDVGHTIKLIQETILNKRPFLAQYRVLRPDGKQIWIEARGEVSDSEATGSPHFFGTSIDITKRVEDRKVLQDAVAARDTFLSIASHELKTPLTSLKLQSQMAERILKRDGAEAFGDERIRKLINNSMNQADRLTRLVDDMLDVSRISSGKLSMNIEKTDLGKLVTDTVNRFLPQLEAAGCKISVKAEKNLEVEVDAFRYEQVLTNLITNVTRYASMNPVYISIKKQDADAVLRVKDSGTGIPNDKLDVIFERFERLTSASEISGLGLGLNISREIVRAHHGEMRVESEMGKGAEFIVQIPIKQKMDKDG